MTLKITKGANPPKPGMVTLRISMEEFTALRWALDEARLANDDDCLSGNPPKIGSPDSKYLMLVLRLQKDLGGRP